MTDVVPENQPVEVDDESTDEEDHFETLFKPIDISKILRALYACSGVQILLAIITIFLSAYNDNKDLAQTNSIASIVVIVASLFNIYGCWYKDRGGLQLSYLLFIWSIGNGSRYFYSALLDGNKLGGFCSRLQTAQETTAYENCLDQRDLNIASVIVAAIAFLLAIANAWMVSNLTEKIQDHQMIIQRKRDIRFALAAQAQKMRTIKKWRKAFETVALGNKLRRSFNTSAKQDKVMGAFATGLFGDDVAQASKQQQRQAQPAPMSSATIVEMPRNEPAPMPPLMAKEHPQAASSSSTATSHPSGTGIEMQETRKESPPASPKATEVVAQPTPDTAKRRKKKPLPPPPEEPL